MSVKGSSNLSGPMFLKYGWMQVLRSNIEHSQIGVSANDLGLIVDRMVHLMPQPSQVCGIT